MKTVTLDDEAYRLLKAAKARRGESFSEVVKRQFGTRARIQDSFGAWKHVPTRRLKELRKETIDAFERTDR